MIYARRRALELGSGGHNDGNKRVRLGHEASGDTVKSCKIQVFMGHLLI